MELTRTIAENALAEAERLNPGPWADHSRYVALACRNIANRCPELDQDLAYIYGLLHDIGRYAGVTSERHLIDGYRYCGAGLGEGGTDLHFPRLYGEGYFLIHRCVRYAAGGQGVYGGIRQERRL